MKRNRPTDSKPRNTNNPEYKPHRVTVKHTTNRPRTKIDLTIKGLPKSTPPPIPKNLSEDEGACLDAWAGDEVIINFID